MRQTEIGGGSEAVVMHDEFKNLIDGYCDDTLSPDDAARLNELVRHNGALAQRFAAAMLLHDRLRAELLAESASGSALMADRVTDEKYMASPVRGVTVASEAIATANSWRRRWTLATVVASVAFVLLAFGFWQGGLERPASAAVVELTRIIQANSKIMDRTFQIKVEQAVSPARKEDQPMGPEDRRPPKPPMDDSVLHVRGGGQFVLVRQTEDGRPFVTGCNGSVSWAVRPTGPVRFSRDLDRFNHDVPGHEHAMPLINIQEGLERLSTTYDVQLLPVESDDEMTQHRLLVAVKKPKARGPRRVEITYEVQSGLIQQMRFVDMPYGPDRLTLRLTLWEERDLGATFFDHASHHAPNREVVEE